MNVLSDFLVRVEEQYPLSIENEELNALLTTIRNQSKEIEQLNREISLLRTNIINSDETEAAAETEEKPAKKTTRKATTKKPAAKKE